MDENIANELRLLLNHYVEIMGFVNEKITNLFLQWQDNYEVLIFKTAKNLVENFLSEGVN